MASTKSGGGARSLPIFALPHRRLARRPPWLLGLLLAVLSCSVCRAQLDLPDAPRPKGASLDDASLSSPMAEPAAEPAAVQQTFPPAPRARRTVRTPGLGPNYLPVPEHCFEDACSQIAPQRVCCRPDYDTFGNYLKQNAIRVYTPTSLAGLAFRGVIDPFNLITIGGTSAISVASSPHSPYGPGMRGWTKQSGVTLVEDMTSEFVGTFMIPSIDHQDPHYYRMPNLPIIQRVAHCIYQPFWTVSQTGEGMVNYSNVLGAIIEEAVDISYVPYQRTGWGPSAARIATNYATMPIGNFVTEFVPDVARHINLHAVILQRIINRVAVEEGGGAP